MKELQDFINKQGEWCDATFPGESLHGKLKHLAEEVEEVRGAHYDLTEYADVALLFFNSLREAGFSVADLFVAMKEKHAVNMTRRWKNGRHIPDGTENRINP